MAVIGTATVNIKPKFPGLQEAIKSEFAKAVGSSEDSGTETGKRYAQGMGQGIAAKTGIIAGAMSAITTKAMSAVSSHVDDAISRFDTLNNYPKVMQTLGYSSEAAEASINTLSDRLQTLPTTLDSMVSTTQRLVTTTGDLQKATDGSLALNDLLLAGGANQQVVNAAMEQFQQILVKGKPEMEDWRSILTAAPGQMDQLAKAMLGPEAKANDLYAALGGGKNDPIFTMDELLDEIIELDQVGGDGITSFREQAETASGGVSTSIANMGNAITRGITSVMDTIGKDNISGVISDMKGGINDAFKAVNGFVSDAMPVLEDGYEVIKQYGPGLLAAAAGFTAVRGIAGKTASAIDGFSKRMDGYVKSMTKAGKSATGFGKIVAGLGGPLNVATAAIGIGFTAFSLISTAIEEGRQKQENFAKATTGLTDAVKNAAGLDEYRGRVSGIGESAGISALSVDDLAEAGANLADTMNQRNSEAESQIGLLNEAQRVIENSIGATDLSAEANGRLEWALKHVNDQFGLTLGKEDVLNGFYEDQEGNVQDLTESIENLIETKKREIQMNVLSQDYEDAYRQWREAEKTVGSEYTKVDRAAVDRLQDAISRIENSDFADTAEGKSQIQAWESEIWELTHVYDEAVDARDKAKESCAELEKAMGREAAATSEDADQWTEWAAHMNDSVKAVAESTGGFDNLVDDMRALGIDTAALGDVSEEEWLGIASTYNGTIMSLIQALSGYDGAVSETAQKTYENAIRISDSLKNIGAEGALQDVGVNINDFAWALENAQVKAEDLEGIASEDFASMAQACGGNVDQMIAAIQMYNAEPIIRKDGGVYVEETTLIDALGNIYKWNGQGLENIDGSAVVDDVQLMDAQGNVVEWNNSELKMLESTATVEHSSVWDAVAAIRALNRQDLEDRTVTYTVNYVTNGERPNAAGGIRLNAEGGYRFHAAGAIATRAVPLDIVGEAGAEAIVPLTNRRYAMPFVKMIADEVAQTTGSHDGSVNYINIRMSYDASADAKTITRGIARQIKLHGLMRG